MNLLQFSKTRMTLVMLLAGVLVFAPGSPASADFTSITATNSGVEQRDSSNPGLCTNPTVPSDAFASEAIYRYPHPSAPNTIGVGTFTGTDNTPAQNQHTYTGPISVEFEVNVWDGPKGTMNDIEAADTANNTAGNPTDPPGDTDPPTAGAVWEAPCTWGYEWAVASGDAEISGGNTTNNGIGCLASKLVGGTSGTSGAGVNSIYSRPIVTSGGAEVIRLVFADCTIYDSGGSWTIDGPSGGNVTITLADLAHGVCQDTDPLDQVTHPGVDVCLSNYVVS